MKLLENISLSNSTNEQIKSSITINNTECFISKLLRGKIEFCTSSSYFPERSEFISTYTIITAGKRRLGLVNFISSIAIPYRNTHSTKIYRVLAIFKIINQYLK